MTHWAHFIYGYKWRQTYGKVPISESGRKEMCYLTAHWTHFSYGYMVKDHSDSEREETRSRLWVTLSDFFLYASSNRQDNTYHGVCLHQSWSTGWNEKWVHHEGLCCWFVFFSAVSDAPVCCSMSRIVFKVYLV